MTEPASRSSRLSRETRLLFLTIVVSGIVLLLLARLRFPERSTPVDTTQPLERLASRASFEELATRVARLEESIAPSLIVLRLSPRIEQAPRRLRDVLVHPEAAPADVRHVPALRIDTTAALAVIPPDVRISGIVRPQEPSGTAGIAATDPVRHLARVRVPEGQLRAVPLLAMTSLQTPVYVVAVEGTQAGLTLRPVFLGRSDRFTSPRWTRPLLPLGGALVTPGALIFTLDGLFLGCVVIENGTLAIAGATDVMEAVARVETASPPVDAGLGVQPLTSAVAMATGAARGVVVAHVMPGSPASGVLEPGDVITHVGETTVDDPESLLLRLGAGLAEGAVQLTVIRKGSTQRLELRGPSAPQTAPSAKDDKALVMQGVANVGTRIRSLDRRSAFAEAGLLPDDLIVRAGGVSAPSPSEIREELEKKAPGDFLLLVLRRGEMQRVTAVRAETSGHAAAR